MKNQIFALSIIAGLTGCLGGESLPNYYTEASTDAEITSENADDVVEAVVDGMDFSSSFQAGFKPKNRALQKAVRTALELSDLEDDSSLSAGDTDGDCGGKVSVSVSQTSGSITYSDYCVTIGETQVTTNGSMDFSGSVSQTGPSTINYTMDLQTSSGEHVSKVAGTMKMTIDQEFNTTIEMDVSGSDSQSGDSFLLQDYKMVMAGFTMSSISGKVCTSDLGGCVTVATTTDFASEGFGDYTAGTLEITSGETVIEISVADGGDCNLILDGETLETEDCTNYL